MCSLDARMRCPLCRHRASHRSDQPPIQCRLRGYDEHMDPRLRGDDGLLRQPRMRESSQAADLQYTETVLDPRVRGDDGVRRQSLSRE